MYTKLEEYKAKLRVEAQKAWPHAAYPEVCWVFDRMGIDPNTVAAQPFSKKYYYVFARDENGNRVHNQYGDVIHVRRKFTPEQQKELRKWWILLPEAVRIEYA